MTVDEIKRQFLEDLIEIKPTTTNVEKKLVTVHSYKIRDDFFRKKVLNTYKKRIHTLQHVHIDDYIMTALVHATTSVMGYKFKKGDSPENILIKDTFERKQLFSYIFSGIDIAFRQFEYDLENISRKDEVKVIDGKREYKYSYYKLETDSINKLTSTDDGGENEMVQILGDDSSVYSSSSDYHLGDFLRFVKENYENLSSPLIRNRVETLVGKDLTKSYTSKDRELETGIKAKDLSESKYHFKKAVLKEYGKHEYKSFNQVTKERHLQMVDDLINMKDAEEISQYLRDAETNLQYFLTDLFHDNLKTVYLKDFTKCMNGGTLTYFTIEEMKKIAANKMDKLHDWQTDFKPKEYEVKNISWDEMDKHNLYVVEPNGMAYKRKSEEEELDTAK